MENQRSSLKESLRLVVTIFVQTQSILSVEEDSNGETKDVPIRVANRQLKTIILRMMTEAMSTNLHNLHQDIRLSDKTLGCLRSVVTLMCLGMGLEIIQRNIHLIRNAQTVATADLKPSFGYMHAKYLSRKTCLKLENKFDVLVRASAHKYKGIHLFDGNRRRGWAEKAGPKAAVFFGEVTDLMSDNCKCHTSTLRHSTPTISSASA